jgi:hypothetical protein
MMGDHMMWCWNPRWPFDGIYGPQTAQGVRNFQKMHKLMVDGVAGPKTLAALGLKGRTLMQGAKGADVMALQKALAKHQEMMTKPMPKPTPKPSPKPTPMPTMKPTPMPTPMATPMPTPKPTMAPTMRPTPKPTMKPTEAPMMEEGMNRPTLELHAADWFLPTTPGGAFNYTPSATSNWMGGGTLWFGDMGIGGDVTTFPTFVGAPGATPVNGIYMYDGDLKWRSAKGQLTGSIGYRGLNTQSYNLGTIGLRWDFPLGTDWLWLNLGGKGGYNFSNAYMLDGKAGLDLHLGPVLVGGGYRYLWLNGPGGQTTWQAPYAGVGLNF